MYLLSPYDAVMCCFSIAFFWLTANSATNAHNATTPLLSGDDQRRYTHQPSVNANQKQSKSLRVFSLSRALPGHGVCCLSIPAFCAGPHTTLLFFRASSFMSRVYATNNAHTHPPPQPPAAHKLQQQQAQESRKKGKLKEIFSHDFMGTYRAITTDGMI